MDRLTISRALAAAAAALVVAVPVWAGAFTPGYSHQTNYISELGALGMPLGTRVSFGGFLPIGILTIAFLTVAAPLIPRVGVARVGYWLLLGVGGSYIGAALARCDPGCPATGSSRQALHNLLGLAEYGGGGVGLLLLARRNHGGPNGGSVRFGLGAAGAVTLLSLLLMGAPEFAPWRGLAQRAAEAALFGSLLLLGWQAATFPSAVRASAAALLIMAMPAPSVAQQRPLYDLVIVHGRVVDPASGLDAIRTIGISGGTIRAVSRHSLRGRDTLDARGLVVAPGFIDLHQHAQDSAGYRVEVLDGTTTALELEEGTDDVNRW